MKYQVSLVLFCFLASTFGTSHSQNSQQFFEENYHNNKINNRIVGGRPAVQGAFPYQVSIQNYGKHVCGGSIINPQWILTAGHCISGAAPHQVKVVVGTNNLKQGGIEHEVEKVILHPDYDWSELVGDIGLIKVLKPITYSYSIGPISLPASDKIKANTKVITSGWGKTKVFGEVSTILKYFNTRIVSLKLCRLVNDKAITEKNICTYALGKGACDGDDGGPVVANGVQVGIVSNLLGYPCAIGVPDVHTRVYSYIDWINGHLSN